MCMPPTLPTSSSSRDEFHLVPVGGTSEMGKPCNDILLTTCVLVTGECLVWGADRDGKEEPVLLKGAPCEGV